MYQIKDAIVSFLGCVEEAHDRRGAIRGLPTGFKDFDLLTSGLQDSELVVIASPPKVGKTAFALNIVDFVSTTGRHGVAIFSVGMNTAGIVQRLMCSRARVEVARVQDGFLSEADFPKLALASANLLESPVFIDDSGILTLDELKIRAKNVKDEHGIKLVVVENIHRLHSSTRRAIYSREVDRTEVMATLRAIAEELSIPVLALSRLIARRPRAANQRLLFETYREAESIEDYADVIGLLERPEHTPEDEISRDESHDKARLTIVKNEDGPLGEMSMTFHKRYLRFEA